jgi:hypothetical protein
VLLGGQQLVEEWHRRALVEGGAFGEEFLPSCLEGLLELGAHPVGCVGVQAAHLVAEALLGEDLGRAFLGIHVL